MVTVTPEILAKYGARVAFGAASLDANKPDWWEKIDKARLDTSHTVLCPLGQLYDGYDSALSVMDWDDDDAAARGFFLRCGEYDNFEAGYELLDELWIAEIDKRMYPQAQEV
ncbi:MULTISPECIES: hypothetical protein [Streptosporangium]|uniref:Uncharacterized protein n=1 Tax=Streptosporangium brasiliense TaxID=47480 RepID=A0ABT9RM59_9ACTN|nr:hypothetical protein [Streptosporangium brasiliense]MDP9870345.1 hypothetical protein [Streptosporangium brasiliense]